MSRSPSKHVALVVIAACHGGGTSTAPRTSSLEGTWRGRSTCLVKPSACNDEVAVYHVTGTADSYTVVGNKVVDGKEQEMGTLTCQVTHLPDHDELRCPFDNGTFVFVVDGDHLRGRLELTDGTKFRDIDVARDR